MNSFFNAIYRFREQYLGSQIFTIILALYLLVPLFFNLHFSDAFDQPKFAILLVGVGIGLLVWISKKGQNYKIHWPWLISIAFFLLAIIAAAFFAPDKWFSFFGHYLRPTNSVLFFSVWSALLFLLLQTLNLKRVELIFSFLGITAALIGSYFILQAYDIGYYAGLETQRRSLAPGFLGNPNFSSMFLSGVVPLIAYLGYKANHWGVKLWWGVAGFLGVWGIVMMSSRAAIIAVCVGLVGMVLAALIWKLPRALGIYSLGFLAATILLSTLFYSAFRPGSIQSTADFSEPGTSNRLMLWVDTIDLIKAHPLVGVGPGNFYTAFKKNQSSVWVDTERFDDAHNIFLHIASSDGLPAILAFLFIILVPLVSAAFRYWQNKDLITLTAIFATISLLISMAFNPVVIPCWILLAFLLATLIYPNAKEKIYNLKFGLRIAVGAVSLIFIVYALSLVASEVLEYHARYAYKLEQYEKSQKFAKLAVIAQPINTEALQAWAGTRIKLNQEPLKTAAILEYINWLHGNSTEIISYNTALYHELNRQTGNDIFKKRLYELNDEIMSMGINHVSVYNQLAYMYFQNNDYAEARVMSYRNIAAANDQYYPWVLLSQINLSEGKRKQLEYSLKNASILNPTNRAWRALYDQVVKGEDLSKITLPIQFPDLYWQPQQ